MANVSAQDVKKLRDMTSAGFGDCRKALIEANGDYDEAVRLLRMQGSAKAEKKQGRATGEGLVKYKLSEDSKRVAFVEVNCETDFVAREATFESFADALLETLLAARTSDMAELIAKPIQEFTSVEAARENLVMKVGENVQIGSIAYQELSEGAFFGYQHGQKISVVVALDNNDAAAGKDVAIHVAAMQPMAVSADDLPESMMAKERAIYEAQMKDSGKPQNILDKIITGKMKKFAAGMCLNGQAYVKDPAVTVEEYTKSKGCKVLSFIRFQLGQDS